VRWLSAQSSLVQRIPEETQEENGHRETVTTIASIAAREFGEGLVAVLQTRSSVPKCGIEDDAPYSDCLCVSKILAAL
jgi:hypothetical protein